MKKQILLAVTLLAVALPAICTTASAQKPDTAWLMIHYKYSWVMDTTNRTHPRTENMVLLVGKRASAYRSYDALVADQQFKKAYAEAVANSPDGRPMINRRGGGTRTQYYQYPAEQKMFTRQNVSVNDYLFEGPMPVIDWKIGEDTATFGGLHCQKATGHFKGRDYIAWFCPDLPVHSGPWKLNGLPGIIVDAHDVKNEVVFQFDGVEKTLPTAKDASSADNTDQKDLPPILHDLNYDPNLIVPPTSAIPTTQKEFDRLHALEQKDPAAFAQALNAANSQAGVKTDIIVAGPKRAGGPAINNPVELPEK